MLGVTSVIVLVSGGPGAGKTTLARPLAAALALPLLSKDVLKESIYDSLGFDPGDAAASKLAGSAAMELLWALAADCPRVVLEANFRPSSDDERRRIAELRRLTIEVYCACPVDLASERFVARAARPGHHGAHPKTLSAAAMAEWNRPLDVGALIEVDTTAAVDVDQLARRIRTMLGEREVLSPRRSQEGPGRQLPEQMPAR